MMKKLRTEGSYCVYKHVRLDNNEVFYIGIGNKHRPYNTTHRNKWWKKISKKTNHDVFVLCDNLTKEEACEIERYLIKFYGRKDLGLGTLCNMTDGGEGPFGIKRSKETKDKIRNHNLNKVLSDETKNKISLSKKGINNPRSKKVINTVTLEEFSSATEAANSIGMNVSTFYLQIKGVNKNKTNFIYV